MIKVPLIIFLVVLFAKPEQVLSQDEITSAPQALHVLLEALLTGKSEIVLKVSTDNGYQSLVKYISPSSPPDCCSHQFQSWGEQWSSMEVIWVENESYTAILSSSEGENFLEFILTDEGWKFDNWEPGQY